ncbi:hypothetical protein PUN28_013177 [Cardiocondyla obscurior]|uniref:Uncharacterized protein n=1 Tax=Cardiocondyla obscurior TaxID=286306 RepID=A0AAW2FBB8_9HYME
MEPVAVQSSDLDQRAIEFSHYRRPPPADETFAGTLSRYGALPSPHDCEISAKPLRTGAFLPESLQLPKLDPSLVPRSTLLFPSLGSAPLSSAQRGAEGSEHAF